MILNYIAGIILLQVPLAKSNMSLRNTIHYMETKGLRARGRSLRMTLNKGIAKHTSSQSPAIMFY